MRVQPAEPSGDGKPTRDCFARHTFVPKACNLPLGLLGSEGALRLGTFCGNTCVNIWRCIKHLSAKRNLFRCHFVHACHTFGIPALGFCRLQYVVLISYC